MSGNMVKPKPVLINSGVWVQPKYYLWFSRRNSSNWKPKCQFI